MAFRSVLLLDLATTKKRKKKTTSSSSAATASGAGEPTKKSDADPSSRQSLKDAKVLIVEDDPASRRLLHLVVSLAGAQDVREAGDAETTVRLLESFTPDLVLIDLVLPNIGGFELLAALRRSERQRARRAQRRSSSSNDKEAAAPSIVYIAISAFTSPGIEARALEAGFNAFIEKPFDVETIADNIAEVLRGARGGSKKKGGMIQ
jgi:PleD family two-component response regulator